MSGLTVNSAGVTRGGRTILTGVSLQIEPGEFLSIVGPNGSGKSSLLRAMAGIWPLSSGSIRIGSRSIGELGRRELAQIVAFVPQDTRMDFAFTVEEIVAMGRHPRRGRFERASPSGHGAIDSALERCDIAYLRDRLVTTLSGGERQRVAIARSLAAEPEVILLDEPTASLDVQHVLAILELCNSLAESGKAVVLATHDLNAVARYTRRVALIDGGRIAYAGNRDEVLTPGILKSVFGVSAELLVSAGGHPVYVFHQREDASLRGLGAKP